MRMLIILALLFFSSYALAETNNMTNTIKATVGKEVVITLEANATTGYQWQLAKPLDESLLKLVSSEYLPDKTELVGVGGKQVWVFQGIKEGKTVVYFKYIRPWEKNIPPEKKASFVAIIGK